MATVLYTALVDLEVNSAVANWRCPASRTVPLDPSKPSTQALLAAGSIELAAPGAVDDATPPRIVRGMPGLHTGVAN